MPYATVTDVATRLGRPISDASEIAQVDAWLGDVESIILSRIVDLSALIASGSPTAAVVAMVEANAVVRKVKNPDGLASETVDDYTYRRNDVNRRGDLFLTDEEWALLSPGSGEGAFTIRPFGHVRGSGTWLHPDTWVPAP